MQHLTLRPTRAALVALLSPLPFIILNTITMNRLEPFLSLLRPNGQTNPVELLVLGLVLLVLPLGGAVIALSPSLRKDSTGERRWYLTNLLVATVLTASALTLSAALGADIYACDILKIPNCD